MKALVTGGAGFIGSWLVAELLRAGYEVLVFDNFSTGRRGLLPTLHELSPQLTTVEGDIVQHEQLRRAMQEWAPAVVFHLAAVHYLPYCDAHPRETVRVNVEGTQSVLEAARASGAGRLVIASSAAVYGISDRANRESDVPGPMDIYGITKWNDELLLRLRDGRGALETVAARLFNVYGPYETNPHVIPQILQQVLDGDTIELGNLDTFRDFIYVDDVARALIMLAEAPKAAGGVFNVGTGIEYSVRDVVRLCAELTGCTLDVRSNAGRRRAVDRQHLLADRTHIAATVGWAPRYDLRAGLAETIRVLMAGQGEESAAVRATVVPSRGALP